MDDVIFLAEEGIAFLKRREYNIACEKMVAGRTILQKCDAEARRLSIDEINRALFIINRTYKEIQSQLACIREIDPHVELSAVTYLLTDLKRKKAQLETNKRHYTRRNL